MGQHAHELPAAAGAIGDGEAHSPTITRRTLLGGAAAAGAASLLTPATGLASPASARSSVASAASARSSVSSRWLGHVSGESAQVLAPREFSLVGVEWTAPAAARVELRSESGGRWSPWAIASVRGHDGDGQPPGPPLFGEPIWTGPSRRVQVRSDGPVSGLALHFVSTDAPGLLGAGPASAPPLALPILDAGPGQPPILARRAWAGRRARPTHYPEYGTVDLAFVHHTVSANGYSAGQVPSILRSIFDYHVYVRGFWDIAYNFLIDEEGRIWEGRAGGIDMAVMGAQAGGYNLESTGVAMIGNFMGVLPSAAALAALEQLLAWKLALHGIPSYGRVTVVVDPSGARYTPFAPGAHVSLPRVAGHRDGDSTDCPGDVLYHHLPRIRPRVSALAGTPAVLELSVPTAAVPAGSPVTLSGQLRLLTGAPLSGAPIELEQLGAKGPPATTIATTTTADDGTWSASLSSQTNVTVRAVHVPYPASVADWAVVPVAPVLTLQLQSTSPLTVSGTISPGKHRVKVSVYRSPQTSGRPLARRRVSAGQGQFTAELPVPGPGSYVVVARSPGDSLNAPGVSPPLSVTVS